MPASDQTTRDPGTATALGVDVGGTTIKVGRVRADGTLTDTRTVPTPRDPHHLADAIAAEVERSPAPTVGVVTPGITDEQSGIISFAANLGWRDVPMREILEQRLGRPVSLGHDVRAGALAESLWGAGSTDMLFVPLGTGIASALVLDGAVRGTGWAGEIGQVLVPDPDEQLPPSGPTRPSRPVRRAFEQISSASAIADRYARRTGSTDVSGGSAHVLERAAGSEHHPADPIAVEVVRTAVETLADVLAQAAGLLGPVPIVLGGGLAHAGEDLLGPLQAGLEERLPAELRPSVRGQRSAPGPVASAPAGSRSTWGAADDPYCHTEPRRGRHLRGAAPEPR
ncbi:ROK family protein [Ruania alba]|uniref:Glucokinase n=1 Tax=Ruania alba TaxID=648782 RepID=A0A1H5EQA3_9MICO|nr:ROK family protein [Ruania alba]SED93144.1 glucokinase [Ruania alba]